MSGDEADLRNSWTAAASRGLAAAQRDVLVELVGVLGEESFRRDGALNPTTWLRRRCGLGRDEARRLVRLARLLIRRPDLADAFFDEATTVAHLDLIAGVATERRAQALDEHGDQLVEYATRFGADEFERICHHWAAQADEHIAAPPDPRDHHLTLTPTLFGESDIRGHLNAHTTAAVGAAFDELCRPDPVADPTARSLPERRADALGDLAHRYLDRALDHESGEQTLAVDRGRSRPSAIVVLDWQSLVGASSSAEPGSVDLASIRREMLAGGAIPGSVADQFTCDANVRRLVLDSNGQPLNIGRPVATVSVAQRRALAVRDGGCVFPMCDRPAAWTDAHHLHHRAHGGPTDVDNLVLLCRRHHRLIHGPEWTLIRNPASGHVTAIRSDGTRYRKAPDGTVSITAPDETSPPQRE